MSQPVSPFTLDQLIAVLDQIEIPFLRQEDGTVLVYFCNRGVPHELRVAVLPEYGYCAIAQHNLVVCSPELVAADRIAELCRFTMLLNGMLVFGGFMIRGPHECILSYGAAIPTTEVLLAPAQLQQAIAVLCGSIDDTYPFLQQVLWCGVSADEALARFRAYLHSGANDDEADEDGLDTGDEPPDRSDTGRAMNETDIAAVDDAFLQSLDPNDPFSVAAAEAILRQRGVQQRGPGSADAAA